MAKKNETKNESANKVIKLTKAEEYFVNRVRKLLEHVRMTDNAADAMIEAINVWKSESRVRAIKRIDDEIARLEELKKNL